MPGLDQPVTGRRMPLSPRRRWIAWTAMASVTLHGAVLATVLQWLHRPAPLQDGTAERATVQLVMSPPGNDRDAFRSEPHAIESLGRAATPPSDAEPPPSSPEPATAPPGPAQPPSAEPPRGGIAAQSPSAQPAASPLTLDLGGVTSDTNALVTGDIVVPASADPRFHNRKPNYPIDAAGRGEQGAVILLIHVTADGLVSGADVLQTSGFARLDQAARDAVLTWHFLPSVKAGQPIEADVPMRILFAIDF